MGQTVFLFFNFIDVTFFYSDLLTMAVNVVVYTIYYIIIPLASARKYNIYYH